ncbi:metal ABC transporter ATP-binding protein [Staphylococcus massiliensis]|uniref:metal ABC transporter ATP-binding protein n=1 Tax=Staphylococcus massiliensis TaxID=555791 RepID=UPI001EDD6EA5|nr:metal ABC transporter ATP-binding protein [Staphylococcus massiliensis]
MLEIKNLHLFLGNRHVLQNINLALPINGDIIGVMGPNGAGKSSLLKSITKTFKASGQITINDQPIHKHLKKLSYIPQKSQLDLDFPINVEKVILSGCFKHIGWFRKISHYDKGRYIKLIKDLELYDLRHRQIKALSGGQLQRVLVARALMSQSDVYLLDEPFTGIDFHSEAVIFKQIEKLKQEGKLVIIVHHDIQSARDYFDKVILINQDIIAFGETQDVLTDMHINRTFNQASRAKAHQGLAFQRKEVTQP